MEIIENTYKSGDKEVRVITGKNAKCPNGFKILKSNTDSLICIKDTIDDPVIPVEIQPTVDLDPPDLITYPFNRRDDVFTPTRDKSYIGMLMILFIILILIIDIAHRQQIKIFGSNETNKHIEIINET